MTVNSGGFLAGTGTVGNTTVNSGGTLASGNGTAGSSMNVTGSLAFQSGAFYMVQLNPATSSFTNVTGAATLGGSTVKAIYANGSYVVKQYTILTAASVSGTFASVAETNLPSNVHATLSYDATHAYLNLVLSFIPPPGSGLSGNQERRRQRHRQLLQQQWRHSARLQRADGRRPDPGLRRDRGGIAADHVPGHDPVHGHHDRPVRAGRGDGTNAPRLCREVPPRMPTPPASGAPEASARLTLLSTARRRWRALCRALERVGRRLRRLADHRRQYGARLQHRDQPHRSAPPPAPTIGSRRTRSPALRWPAAAPISASPMAAADAPTCSRPAPSFAIRSARPMSPPRWLMAGRT